MEFMNEDIKTNFGSEKTGSKDDLFSSGDPVTRERVDSTNGPNPYMQGKERTDGNIEIQMTDIEEIPDALIRPDSRYGNLRKHTSNKSQSAFTNLRTIHKSQSSYEIHSLPTHYSPDSSDNNDIELVTSVEEITAVVKKHKTNNS